MAAVEEFLNAAAVWFLLKSIEVLLMASCDISISLHRFLRFTTLPDIAREEFKAEYYDSRRGKLEYIISGAGFADLRLRKRHKKWLLIATLVPILLFCTELFSIYLGFNKRTCQTAKVSDVDSPSLVLFGNGKQVSTSYADGISDYDDFKELEEDYGTPFGNPCVRWPSTSEGVVYSAKICGETASIVAHVAAAAPQLAVPSNTRSTGTTQLLNKHIATMIPTNLKNSDFFYIRVYAMKSPESKDDLLDLGSIRFSSQVLVGGKNILIRNATSKGYVSSAKKERFRSDFEKLDDLYNTSNNISDSQILKGRPEYWENDGMFGFLWNLESYMTRGGLLMTYALLSQATTDFRRNAMNMSLMNNEDLHDSSRLHKIRVSCGDGLIISMNFSVVVIATAIFVRLFLILFRGPVSSPEFALTTSEEIANMQESSVFFMDRQRAVCTIRYTNNGVSNHVGYTSVGEWGVHPKLPWR